MNFKNQRYFTTETTEDRVKDGGNVENSASSSIHKQKFGHEDDNFVAKISDRTDEYGDIRIDGLTSGFQEKKQLKRRIKHKFAAEHAKRAEILLSEEPGAIDVCEGESTFSLTQKDIVANADIATASKSFSLDLEKFGPYKIDYARSGRYLLLGGKFGHVAAIDWLTKDLLCEINVMESVRDIKWLHNELMYAVAQKNYTYLYDSQGTEIHCLKRLHKVLQLDFLPYHFLLAASCESSFLHWVDVSMGKLVASFPTKSGPLRVMHQNPSNAILHCGQNTGIVSLWSPNVKEPLVKLLCHRGPISSLAVDHTGSYMATSSTDRLIKIWDLRTLKPLFEYKLLRGAQNLAFSQNKFLACSVGNDIQVFDKMCSHPVAAPYLVHRLNELASDLSFSPFEDVLGVGCGTGFQSLLVPGAALANFDVYEPNPFQSRNQRREAEVKGLLDKIQPELISLDDDLLARIDQKSIDDVLKDKLEILTSNKVVNSKISLKHKAKGKSDAGNVQKRRQLVRTAKQRELITEQKKVRQELISEGILEPEKRTIDQNRHILDRFRRKQ